jgi:hypothetical protein
VNLAEIRHRIAAQDRQKAINGRRTVIGRYDKVREFLRAISLSTLSLRAFPEIIELPCPTSCAGLQRSRVSRSSGPNPTVIGRPALQ